MAGLVVRSIDLLLVAWRSPWVLAQLAAAAVAVGLVAAANHLGSVWEAD